MMNEANQTLFPPYVYYLLMHMASSSIKSVVISSQILWAAEYHLNTQYLFKKKENQTLHVYATHLWTEGQY